MHNTSFLELSENALKHNLNFIRKNLCKSSKLSCVVKGNAYGHGIAEYVPLLIRNKVDHICVFSSFEARQVAEVVPMDKTTILIMGDINPAHFDWVVANEVEFFVFDIERLKVAKGLAEKLGKRAIVHMEVETGMNRLGLNRIDLTHAIKYIQDNSQFFQVEGLCTHYAGSESIANHTRVKNQIKNFRRAREICKELDFHPRIIHTACSGAALRFPKTRHDMIRVGILQYGFWPSEETFIAYAQTKKNFNNPLRRVISWKSRVMSLKDVNIGEFIGYGTSYMASEAKRLAIVPVGYSNGFARSLSNSGRVIINRMRTQVVGTVNMNAITVDVTHLGDVKVGDEVILIGASGDAEIGVSSFANFSDQLNYEVLARLPKDISRIVV